MLVTGAAGGKSATELSVMIGGTLNPAECLVRVRSILQDRDVWTDPERRKLLMHRVYTLVDDLADLADKSGDSKDFTALTRALDLLRKVLAEQGQATEEELQRFVQLEARQMLLFINTAMDRAGEILAESHPDIPSVEIAQALQQAMVEVHAE